MKVSWFYTSVGDVQPDDRYAKDNKYFTLLANVIHEQGVTQELEKLTEDIMKEKSLEYYQCSEKYKYKISDKFETTSRVAIYKKEITEESLEKAGKIYFGILSKRITKFLLKNYYIDTSIQKGGVPGTSGCLEHTAILSQLIREAKAGGKNLTAVWLDIANAYSVKS